jgi:hypothetical protein
LKKIIKNPIAICFLANLLILLYEYFKIELSYFANNNNSGIEELIKKLLVYVVVPFAIYVFFIISLIIIVSKKKYIQFKLVKTIAIILLIILTAIGPLYVPYSNTVAKLQYIVNKEHYADTVQKFSDGQLQRYHAEDDIYVVPYMFTSYTRLVTVQEKDGVTKIRFDIYEGLIKFRVIIYSSDDSGINSSDFSFQSHKYSYGDIHKIDTNWYSATVKY